jgi:hypothetical protein
VTFTTSGVALFVFVARWRGDLVGGYDAGIPADLQCSANGAIPMSISQVLFDAINAIEAELQKPGEYGQLLGSEIATLVNRMKEVQQKLDTELTEIDGNDDE